MASVYSAVQACKFGKFVATLHAAGTGEAHSRGWQRGQAPHPQRADGDACGARAEVVGGAGPAAVVQP
jgi:hypothetical protein